MFLPRFKQNAVAWFQNFARVISTLRTPALLALAIPMVQKRSLLVQVFWFKFIVAASKLVLSADSLGVIIVMY